MKRGALAIVALCGLAAAAPADDIFNVTSSQNSATTFAAYAGGNYVGGSARMAYVNVSNSGTVWTVNSGWDNGFTGAKSFWNMADGSKITVTASAAINNNMSDLINARPFQVAGTNSGEVFELEAGFNADLGTQAVPAGGLSTLTIQDCTLVTHATQNLPSIWKYIPGPVKSHHGLLMFTTGPNGRWHVRTNNQQYEGGVYWKYNWELEVDAGLSLQMVDTAPERAIGADIGFGPYTGTTGTTFTKTGLGTLDLNGEMGWQPNSKMVVSQGTVNFNKYDPAKKFTSGYMNGSGQYLTLDVASGASANLLPETDSASWGVKAIINRGLVAMGRGRLDLTGNFDIYAGATTLIMLGAVDSGRTKITVDGALTQAGTLTIVDLGDMIVGDYDLFNAGTFAGTMALNLPTGYAGSYNNTSGVLTITVVPEPASLALVGLGLAAWLARRRRSARA